MLARATASGAATGTGDADATDQSHKSSVWRTYQEETIKLTQSSKACDNVDGSEFNKHSALGSGFIVLLTFGKRVQIKALDGECILSAEQ